MWQITLKGCIDNFNRAAVNHALKPIGAAVPRNIKTGHALISFADDKLNEAYDQALMNVSFSAGAKLEPKIQEVVDEAHVSVDQARWLRRIIKTRLDGISALARWTAKHSSGWSASFLTALGDIASSTTCETVVRRWATSSH